MSTSGFDHQRKPLPRAVTWLAVLIPVALAVAITVGVMIRDAPTPVSAANGLTVAVAVEAFVVGESVSGNWSTDAFAESLSVQLASYRGIRVVDRPSAQFVLSGNVSTKDGRLILATRLSRGGKRDPVWTATFWRSAASGNSALSDLSSAVAEAVLVESARENHTPKREKP